MSKSELLPCPFCGSNAKITWPLNRHHNDAPIDVVCQGCEAAMVCAGFTDEQATAAWNRRALSPAPNEGEAVAWVTADILAAMRRGERAVPGWKRSDDFCIPLYAGAPPQPSSGKVGDVRPAIFEVLRNHRLSNMVFEGTDDGFCLVDLVSTEGGSIKTGEEQLRDLADEIAFALSNNGESREATHQHVKRGTEYVLIGYGKMQAEKWKTPTIAPDEDGRNHWTHVSIDMREVAIYRSATDPTEIWVRPREEFEDGRFRALAKEQGK